MKQTCLDKVLLLQLPGGSVTCSAGQTGVVRTQEGWLWVSGWRAA